MNDKDDRSRSPSPDADASAPGAGVAGADDAQQENPSPTSVPPRRRERRVARGTRYKYNPTQQWVFIVLAIVVLLSLVLFRNTCSNKVAHVFTKSVGKDKPLKLMPWRDAGADTPQPAPPP